MRGSSKDWRRRQKLSKLHFCSFLPFFFSPPRMIRTPALRPREMREQIHNSISWACEISVLSLPYAWRTTDGKLQREHILGRISFFVWSILGKLEWAEIYEKLDMLTDLYKKNWLLIMFLMVAFWLHVISRRIFPSKQSRLRQFLTPSLNFTHKHAHFCRSPRPNWLTFAKKALLCTYSVAQ